MLLLALSQLPLYRLLQPKRRLLRPSLSRGHIMELHRKLANLIKGTRSITEYMQEIQSWIDSRALMNKPVDFDELAIRILNRLDDGYINLSSALQAQETPIEYDELLKKLLHVETQLKLPGKATSSQPTSAFTAPVSSGSGKSNKNFNKAGQSN